MKKSALKHVQTLGLSIFLLNQALNAQVTPGYDLNYDASDITSGIDSANWDTTVDDGSGNFHFDFGGDVSLVTATTSLAGITKAYRFTGGAGDTTSSLESFSPNPTSSSVTFEFWVKPSDLNTGGGADQVIYESGADGDGCAIYYNIGTPGDGMGTIRWLTKDTGYVAVSAPISTDEFRHIVCILNKNVSGNFDLQQVFVDGQLIDDNDSSTVTDDLSNDNDDQGQNDWAGGDAARIGSDNSNPPNTTGFSSGDFDGDIAIFRAYFNQALTPAEIESNYDVYGVDTPPSLSSSEPVDDGSLFAGDPIILTFDENITANTGNITIEDQDGSSDLVFDINDPEIDITDNVLTITPASSLLFNNNYAVLIDAGAVQDDALQDFAGISDPTILNFTTLAEDLVNPSVLNYDPADEETDVSIVENLTLVFNETVEIGSGNITINNVSDGGAITTIDVTDASQVSLATTTVTNDTLIINPTGPLPVEKVIAVQIDGTAIIDLSNNQYSGIGDDTTWNFTTESFPYPVAYWPMRDDLPGNSSGTVDDVIDDPSHDATDGSGGSGSWAADPERGIVYFTPETNRLTAGTQDIDLDKGFTWSLWVKTDGNQTADSGADVIIGSRNGTWNKVQVTSVENWVGIGGYNVDDGEWHHLVFTGSNSPSTAVKLYIDGVLVGTDTTPSTDIVNDVLEMGGTSGFGEDIEGCMSDVAIWEAALPESIIFDLYANPAIIPDAVAPFAAQLSPADDDAAAATGLVQIIFDEPINLGSGDIRVINTSTPGTVTLDVTDPGEVIVGGASLTLTSAAGIIPGESYAIEMDAGVVTGKYSGLPFAGILDQTTWNFTVETTPPAIVSLDPADDSTSYAALQNLTMNFDEPVATGSGNIIFKNLTDATQEVIPVSNTSRVIVSGNSITINPATQGQQGKNYAVQIDAGAINDVSGNAYPGISNDTTWNFTAATAPGGGVLINNTFESGTLEDWTASGGDSGLYMNGDVVSNMTLGVDDLIDYAPTGDYCMWDGRGGSNLYLTNPLFLRSFGYESVSISFNYNIRGASSTRRLNTEYSPDNGATWVTLGFVTGAGSELYTLNKSSYNFTDQVIFRFEFTNSGGSAGPAFIDDVVITGVADTTAPSLVSIVDDVGGGPSPVSAPITYTVTFDESMDASTLNTSDFENGAGSPATISIDSVTPTANDAVFEVVVTPSTTGDLLLQIASGVTINDFSGNALVTASALPDDTTIIIEEAATEPYDIWAVANGLSGPDAEPGANTDGDTFTQLEEFAYGTNPGVSDSGALTVTDGTTFTPGGPVVEQIFSGGNPIKLRYVRRKDHATAGIIYTPKFSDSLSVFQPDEDDPVPVVVSDAGGDYEVVEVPFPLFDSSGQKAAALFGVVEVTEEP